MAKITTANNALRASWQNPPPFLLAIVSVLLIWFWVFDEALLSAASVWWVSDTFNHCFFVSRCGNPARTQRSHS